MPYVGQEGDIEELIDSDRLFARKFNRNDEILLKKIQEFCR